MIEKLSGYIKTLQLSPFFDFLEKFLKVFHGNFTIDNLKLIMDSLVDRVAQEIRKKGKKTLDLRAKSAKAIKTKISKASQYKIAKCWGAIRYIAEAPFFDGPLIPIIEASVMPLLEFVAQPDVSADFDDDIMFFASALMQKSKTCSPVLKEIFPYLASYHARYNYIFGPLLQCLSYYLTYNTDGFLANSTQNLDLLFSMGKNSL